MENFTLYPLSGGIRVTDLISSFSEKRERGFRFSGEMHNFWEFVYIREGSAFVAEEEHVTELRQGMFILHAPMAFHRIWCENEDADVMISAFAANGPLTARLKGRAGVLPVQLREMFEQMIRTGGDAVQLSRDGKDASPCVFRYTAMLEYILTEIAFSERSRKKTLRNADFDRIIEIVHAHYLESPDIARLARLCNMSESKLKKSFAAVYDCGIMKYLCKLRIRDAARMIGEGKSTEDICERLSFSDKNYFSYVFKRETGITPSEYRRSFRETELHSPE